MRNLDILYKCVLISLTTLWLRFYKCNYGKNTIITQYQVRITQFRRNNSNARQWLFRNSETQQYNTSDASHTSVVTDPAKSWCWSCAWDWDWDYDWVGGKAREPITLTLTWNKTEIEIELLLFSFASLVNLGQLFIISSLQTKRWKMPNH